MGSESSQQKEFAPLLNDHTAERRQVGSSPVLKRAQVLVRGRRVLSPSDNADGISWELLRRGEVVHALRIRCACGRTTELRFEYDDGDSHEP